MGRMGRIYRSSTFASRNKGLFHRPFFCSFQSAFTASRMLEHDTPLAVISDILGHTDTDSTSVYLKVDVKKLKECCLDTPEVRS